MNTQYQEAGEEAVSFTERLHIYVPALVILLVGGTMAVQTARYATWLHDEFAKADFASRAVVRASVLQSEIDTAIDDLHATVALFHASRRVEEDEFARFVKPLLARHRGLIAIQWAPRSLTDQGEERFPVRYAVSVDDEPFSIEQDLGAEPERAKALAMARDSGRATTTPPLRAIEGQEGSDAYRIFVPHYRGVPLSVESRRGDLRGFVVGVLSLDTLVESALSSLGSRYFELVVMDETSVVAKLEPADGVACPSTESLFEDDAAVAGRDLRLEFYPTVEFEKAHTTIAPTLGMLGGILLSGVIGLYLTARGRHERDREHAARRLRESERRMRALIENAPDAILVYDVDARHFVDANSNAEALTGLRREQLQRSTPMDFSPPLQLDGRSSSEHAFEVMARALEGEATVSDWLVQHVDGRRIPCELRLVKLPAEGRRLIRASLTDVSQRAEEEQRRRRLVRELDHRVKNTLANVLAIAEQSSASAADVPAFRDAFSGRIRAMARAHEAIAGRQWHQIPFEDLVRVVLAAHVAGAGGRVRAEGPPVSISPEAASSLALVLHELATNAAKYGALATPDGRIELTWWDREESGEIVIEWRERDGKPAANVYAAGVGLRLIRGIVEHELGGRVVFETPGGAWTCRVSLPTTCLATAEKLDEPGQSADR